MFTEIEAKLKVDSLKEIEHKLAELRAEFIAELMQIDFYFDDVNDTLRKTDRCLRLRCENDNKKERFFLTYKGAREKPPKVALNKPGFAGQFKTRQEVEIEIKLTFSGTDSVENLLLALGYKMVLVFDKKRRIWRLGDCVIALDQLPLLGTFVEIEGPDSEKIANIQKTLGLANLPHINESYAFLIEQKLLELGKSKKEIFLSSSAHK